MPKSGRPGQSEGMDSLRVFNTFDRQAGVPNRDASAAREREGANLSEEEVREKIRRHMNQRALQAKAQVSSKGRKLGAVARAKGQREGQTEGQRPLLRPRETSGGVGAIGNNDPNSLMTREKLKELLRSGAFSFNESEKKVLAEILK